MRGVEVVIEEKVVIMVEKVVIEEKTPRERTFASVASIM